MCLSICGCLSVSCYLYVSVYMCLTICVCLHVWCRLSSWRVRVALQHTPKRTHTSIQKHTHKHTPKHTHKHTHKHTPKHTGYRKRVLDCVLWCVLWCALVCLGVCFGVCVLGVCALVFAWARVCACERKHLPVRDRVCVRALTCVRVRVRAHVHTTNTSPLCGHKTPLQPRHRGAATANTLDTRCLFLGRGGPLGSGVKSEACVLGGCEGCTVVCFFFSLTL
jgi:hypothetical protein